MSGLLQLAWIQNRKTFLYLGVVLIILAYLLAAPIGPIKNGVLQMVQENAFLQKLLGAVIGLDLTGEMTLKLLVGGTWGHPFLIACMLGFGTICAARFPAQEIELDHIDLLMSGPASRGKVLTAHTLVGWGCLLVLHIVTLWAFWLGCLPLGSDAPEVGAWETVSCDLGVPLSILWVEEQGIRDLYEAPLALIRPDQHVAWRGEKGDAMEILKAATGRSE